MADRTKHWLADKMRTLMKTKPLEKIRVTEICSAAGIERSTFYYHFKDKYELVAWMFFQAAEEINIIDMDNVAESMQQMKTDLLFYRRAYEDTSQNALWQYMLEYYADKYAQLAREMTGKTDLSPQLLFNIRLYCYGAVGMAKEWVLEDNVIPAETLVRLLFSSMPPSLQQIFF